MMRFTLVVVLIAAVEASTIQPFSDCSSGTAPNNPSNVLNTLSTTYNPGFVLSSSYYSAQGVFATYYNVQPIGIADVGGATTPVKAVRENTVDWSGMTPTDRPYPQSVTNGEFSVRWTGFVRNTLPVGYTYTFHATLHDATMLDNTNTDERVQLWIDNSLVISQWTSLDTANPSGTVSLPVNGDYYSLVMEYKVGTTSARAIQLKWTTSSSNAGYVSTVVSAGLLFPYGNSCSECPSGTYKNMSGAYGVRLCAVVFQTLRYTLAICSVALTFWLQRVTNAGSAACTKCPVNTYTWILGSWDGSEGNSNLTACKCNSGYTGPDGEACQSCPVGTYKNSPGKCKAMVTCNLPQPCVRCTEHCTDKFDATPEYECILQAVKRAPPVPKILQQLRQR
jgi:hypothetical protein